jgi:hypothetical protein
MPAQQRLRRHRERRPAGARKGAAKRREQHAIAILVARTPRPAAQHAELMAQGEDLTLLAVARAAEQDQQLEDPAKRQVQERGRGSTSNRRPKARQAT